MSDQPYSRRTFLQQGISLAAGLPFALHLGHGQTVPNDNKTTVAAKTARTDTRVAVVRCRGYGPEVSAALAQCFDLLGGIRSLVANKTVTAKVNLTGTNFAPFLNRPVGETYMTHFSTVLALGTLLFQAGAKRLRFVESTQSKSKLESSLSFADWDLKALEALGKVEFENTRNLGNG